LGALIPIVGRGAHSQRHASGGREAVDEDAFAFPAIRDALTAAFARGKTSHPQRRTAIESARVPWLAQGAALAWQPASHRLASAAATDAPHFWTPIELPEGDRTSDSR